MGSFGSLQGKKCSKTAFYRFFSIIKRKARQTPRKNQYQPPMRQLSRLHQLIEI
jgi:hypothetical protein